MKLAATSVLALALAAPAVFAQSQDTTSSSTSTATSPNDKLDTRTDASSRSSMDRSATSDRGVATADTAKTADKDCKCDCSNQGSMKRSSNRRSSSQPQGRTGGIDRARPAAPATGADTNPRGGVGPVDSTHTGSTTDTSNPPGTGDTNMNPSGTSNSNNSSGSSTNPSTPR